MADNNPDLVALAVELGASGNEPIAAVGITGKVTLRGAIKTVFWKNASLLKLGNRPVAPTQADDQFGHVLSMRAETLINQAILADIVRKLNGGDAAAAPIDVAAIRANVIRSLSS